MIYAPVRPSRDAPAVHINLYSDTQTRPTKAMKQAMLRAEVGDEQHGDDPTVNALCDRMAALLGKQAAIFLPSGTMCNVIAILTHCRAGEEVIAHQTSHILNSEGAAHAALTGVQILPLAGARGMFTADDVRACIRTRSRNAPCQRLLEVEQSVNLGGGTVWPNKQLNEVAALAHSQGWITHMDGARLMNAVIATGISAKEMAAAYDSVWVDFTKGLGAPLGAVLAGSTGFIDEAWRWKQRLGGSMRQAGICAAACLYALDHHVDRLADDHTNAQALARGLKLIPGIMVEEPETNMVFFDPTGAGLGGLELMRRLRLKGVQLSFLGGRIRACTHLDVTPTMISEAIDLLREELASASGS
jgi:threonine aldolase